MACPSTCNDLDKTNKKNQLKTTENIGKLDGKMIEKYQARQSGVFDGRR